MLGLSNSIQSAYTSLGRNYILPRNHAMSISAGQGYHSTPGYAGMMSCVVQILNRILYSRTTNPSQNEFEFDLFGFSPLGSIILEELSKYDENFGDYQLFHGLRLIFRYMADEMVRLYVPPNSNRARYDNDGKQNTLSKIKTSRRMLRPMKIN